MRGCSIGFFLVILVAASASRAAEIFFSDDFAHHSLAGWQGAGFLDADKDLGDVLHIHIPASAINHSATSSISLPVDKIRGSRVSFGADIWAEAVSAKLQSWNGIKLMLIVKSANGTQYPQADIETGDLPWKRYSAAATIPFDATSVTLVLGLEKVSGDVRFRNVSVSLRHRLMQAPAVNSNAPIYTGHSEPRLRGTMVSSRMPESDLTDLADGWHANVIRWQLIQLNGDSRDLENYDAWLDSALAKLDQVLTWSEKHHVKVVVDLHSPPGGQLLAGGYLGANGRIFSQPAAQQKFLEVWKKIATRYTGRAIIWGFDLMNEPDDTATAPDCDEWQELAAKAARVIHAIDRDRALIVEPAGWANPEAFADFVPLDEPNVVYSFHMYEPHNFTHQGIQGHPIGADYPGTVDGKMWNKAALEAAMKPAFDFASRYHVHLYVGEFSCIRTAPGESGLNYLRDLIDIFEAHDIDWTYHAFREWSGWSAEHEGPLNQPTLTKIPNARQLLLRQWFSRN